MKCLTLCFLIILSSNLCYAGIETELLKEQYENCMVRITHDVTPDSKIGTITFKSYKVTEGIHYPCDTNERNTSASLSNALHNYFLHADLKPVTSIMLGRLIRYPWARTYLDKNTIPRMSHTEFNKIILNSSIISPFSNAINKFSYHITDVSCEKILFNEQGFSIDALCWLEIEK